jgi:hypothetical protein
LSLLDGLSAANPVARRLYSVFTPIARTSVDFRIGIAIDLVLGFAMAGIFLLLYGSMPVLTGVERGLAYGLMVWFFRVAMQVASQWVTFNLPAGLLLYTLISGLLEMTLIGLFYGLTLWPSAWNA